MPRFQRGLFECVGLIALAWMAPAGFVGAAESTAPPLPRGDATAQAPAPEAKAPELFKLKNEDLLKQAQTAYGKADGDLLAQIRELAAAEMALADVRKQIADLKMPASPATAESSNLKAAVDAAKARKAAVSQKLKLAQSQKSLLDRVTAAFDACKTAETAYFNALDDLRGYAVEIDLRIQDATLAANQAPAALLGDALSIRRSELNAASEERQRRAAALAKDQDSVNKTVEEASKAMLAADADLTQASNALAMEEKSQEMKKQYAGRKPGELGAELNALADEGIGLKGTFELGLARFNSAANEVDRLRKAVEAMKPPEMKIPQLARPEDVEQAASGTQKLIDFYAQRSKVLEALAAALAEVLRLGAEFNADATVSTDHLSKMRLIAEVLKSGGTAGVTMVPEAEPNRVLAAEQLQSKQMAGVQAAVERAKTDALVVEKQLAETRANSEAAAGQLARLKQSQAATLAAFAWEAKLKDMKAEQAVEAFNTTAKSLQEKLAALEKQQAEYKAALAAATELSTKLDGLKDPLLRAAEEALQAEKAKILGGLRKDAGLEHAAPTAAAKADAAAGAKPADDADKKLAPADKKPDGADLEKATAALQSFQQLVSGRLRVIEEQERVAPACLPPSRRWRR